MALRLVGGGRRHNNLTRHAGMRLAVEIVRSRCGKGVAEGIGDRPLDVDKTAEKTFVAGNGMLLAALVDPGNFCPGRHG